MSCRRLTARVTLPFLLLVGCQTGSPATSLVPAWETPSPLSFHVPATVRRLAVLYPAASTQEARYTYLRLEGATFQLKALRPSLQIVDRTNLRTILSEQQLQFSGSVSDESAIRVGRVLGADSVLLYQIEIPSLRDQVFAQFHGAIPPVIVTSKIILVESAEVVFYNVVAVPVEGIGDVSSSFTTFHQHPFIQVALDRGLVRTITDLQQAFR